MTGRGGFTMVEMMVVVVIGMIVLGAVGNVLVRQEEAYSRLRAVAGTQQDTRSGVDLLAAELREVSPGGGDLLMATRDSLTFRALREFGLICSTDKNNKRLVVAESGVNGFAAGDSVMVYVDGDTLKASDDSWQSEMVSSVSSPAACLTTLGLSLATLLPSSSLTQLTLQGSGLRWDSVFPGAPVRGYEVLTYRVDTYSGERTLVRDEAGNVSPLLGPLADTTGLTLRYFDGSGNELTTFPLSAADRADVRRIRVEVTARRSTTSGLGPYQGSRITDIHTRGS